MKNGPNINAYDLELVAKVLAVANPGRASEAHIRDVIRAAWPFENISTAGWIAYAENFGETNSVRVALQPYTIALHLGLIAQHHVGA